VGPHAGLSNRTSKQSRRDLSSRLTKSSSFSNNLLKLLCLHYLHQNFVSMCMQLPKYIANSFDVDDDRRYNRRSKYVCDTGSSPDQCPTCIRVTGLARAAALYRDLFRPERLLVECVSHTESNQPQCMRLSIFILSK
jgi:hypothetical protein